MSEEIKKDKNNFFFQKFWSEDPSVNQEIKKRA